MLKKVLANVCPCPNTSDILVGYDLRCGRLGFPGKGGKAFLPRDDHLIVLKNNRMMDLTHGQGSCSRRMTELKYFPVQFQLFLGAVWTAFYTIRNLFSTLFAVHELSLLFT